LVEVGVQLVPNGADGEVLPDMLLDLRNARVVLVELG
jgi:hypothetical protein